jgi:hypothetical protein
MDNYSNIGGMIEMLQKVKKLNGNDVPLFFKDDYNNTFIMSNANTIETPEGIRVVISLAHYGLKH